MPHIFVIQQYIDKLTWIYTDKCDSLLNKILLEYFSGTVVCECVLLDLYLHPLPNAEPSWSPTVFPFWWSAHSDSTEVSKISNKFTG